MILEGEVPIYYVTSPLCQYLTCLLNLEELKLNTDCFLVRFESDTMNPQRTPKASLIKATEILDPSSFEKPL